MVLLCTMRFGIPACRVRAVAMLMTAMHSERLTSGCAVQAWAEAATYCESSGNAAGCAKAKAVATAWAKATFSANAAAYVRPCHCNALCLITHALPAQGR